MDVLFKDISQILSVKQSSLDAIRRLGVKNVLDFLFHVPIRYISRKVNPDLNSCSNNEDVLLDIKIQRFHKTKSTVKIVAQDSYGKLINITFFHAIPNFIYLQLGGKVTVEGKLSKYKDIWQITHPNFILSKTSISVIEPVYPLTRGLKNLQIRDYMKKVIDALPDGGKEYNPLINKLSYNISQKEAFKAIHRPNENSNWQNAIDIARQRLAADELVGHNIALRDIVKATEQPRKYYYYGQQNFEKVILENLGFVLTDGQKSALDKIKHVQSSEKSMLLLLQGDVGSGKTLVMLLSCLGVVAKGRQVAFMVPTELLATQHYRFLQKALNGIDIEIGLLVGKMKKKDKDTTLSGLKSGGINIVVGTQALIQDAVEFADLGYVIIDEQHRFGVQQRLNLVNKGKDIDFLSVSATPIPRSLAITFMQGFDIVSIDHLIPGRKTIKTIISTSVDKIVTSITNKLNTQEKIFWICPCVEKNEDSNMTDVESRRDFLDDIFPGRVEYIHGKMDSIKQKEIMHRFKEESNIKILVATTVIEVGIDISDATVIIIENAERFGLAQLHQLRGRVGRNDKDAFCILLPSNQYISSVSKYRLRPMCEHNDGFKLAQKDLQLRGGGDIVGHRQSGQAEFRFADIVVDQEIIAWIGKTEFTEEEINFFKKFISDEKGLM